MTQNKRGIEKKIFVMLFPEKSKYFPISMLESVSFFLRIEAVSLPQDLEGISHCIKINPKDLSDINIAMESIDLCGDLRLYIRNIVTAIRKEKLIQVSVPLIREEIEHGAKALAALLGFSFVTPDCVLSVIPNVVIHKFIFKSCSRSIAESREMIFKIINNVELPA